jgi:hypothetical protein
MAEINGYYGSDNGQVESYGDTIWLAQTFYSNAALITDVSVLVYREGSPSTCIVSIYSTSGGEPDTALTSFGFNGNTLTTDTDGEWKTFTFGGGGLSVASGLYAIVLRATGGDASNSLHVRARLTSGGFPTGSRWHSTDTGSTWTEYPNDDFVFKLYGSYEYVFEPPSGRPTTKRLIAAAASAIWYEDL